MFAAVDSRGEGTLRTAYMTSNGFLRDKNSASIGTEKHDFWETDFVVFSLLIPSLSIRLDSNHFHSTRNGHALVTKLV